MNGKIIKGIGGFYYIHCFEDDIIYQCRAVGIFRKLGIKPLPGDNVSFDITDTKDLEGSLSGIHPRKNVLIRPAVANVDQALIVFALKDPEPNLNLLDRFLIYMETQKLNSTVFFNKLDLDDGGLAEKYAGIYANAGCGVICGSTSDDSCIDCIREILKGKTTVLAGPSGVGKSSLTNKLYRSGCMEVGEISRKIRRGKQTTRHTEIFTIDPHSYVLDTPGFTSLYITGLRAEELEAYFPEFEDFIPRCRFTGCSHIYEGSELCAVLRAVDEQKISPSRYDTYRRLYAELKEQER